MVNALHWNIMKLTHSLSAVALSLATLGAQATDLVVNGSFEANTQAAGTWNIYNALTEARDLLGKYRTTFIKMNTPPPGRPTNGAD